MTTIEQDILKRLEQCKAEIQANMASKGINASGRTSRSFDVRKTSRGYELVLKHDTTVAIPKQPRGIGSVLVGVAPLQTLEIGRPGGRVPAGFYYIIKQWTRDKGLVFGKESDRQRFSFFTAKKIARQGTGRNRQHVKVYDTPVQQAKYDIERDIRAALSRVVTQAAARNFNY